MRVLGEFQLDLDRLQELDRRGATVPQKGRRVVKVDVFETVLDETISNVVGKLHVSRRSRPVGLLGQYAEMARESLRRRNDLNESFRLELSRRRARKKSR